MGGVGLGKTFLMDCIGHRALEKGYSVQKYTSYNIIDRMLKSIRAQADAPDYISPDLLLIDDLGVEPDIPNITMPTLLCIIIERDTLGRATTISTNLTKDAIQEYYEERFFSRVFSMHSYRKIELQGNDLRFQI
jgi:DNA replication protein DnaC